MTLVRSIQKKDEYRKRRIERGREEGKKKEKLERKKCAVISIFTDFYIGSTIFIENVIFIL